MAMPEDIRKVVDQAEGGRPWWQACCLGCGLTLFALAVAAGWFLHSLQGPGPQHLTALPANFPEEIKILRLKDATIQYVPATQKRGIAERILSPLRLLGLVATSTPTLPPDVADALSRLSTSTLLRVDRMQALNADSVFLSWGPVPDLKPADVISYYRGQMAQGDFHVETVQDEVSRTEILFGDRSDATFQLDVKGDRAGTGIDEMRVVVNYVGQ